MKISLGDLSSIELIKLMNLLNEYEKITIRPFSWSQNFMMGVMEQVRR
jgi:hypothetical protein